MLSSKTNGKRLPTWQRNRWSNGTSISWALSKCRMLSHVSFSDVLPTALYWARSHLRDSEGHDMMKSYEMSSKVWQQFCLVRFFLRCHSQTRGWRQCSVISQWCNGHIPRHQPMVPAGASKFKVVQHRLQARKTTQLTIKIIKSKHHQTSLWCRSETKWDKVRQSETKWDNNQRNPKDF